MGIRHVQCQQAAKAIVDLLKLNGVPANITYKEVFENHLCKLLSTLIKKSADDKERWVLHMHHLVKTPSG